MLYDNMMCYICNNHNHKVAHCNDKSKSYTRRNSFSSFTNYDVRCFKCNNNGHIVRVSKNIFSYYRWQDNRFYQLKGMQ